MYCSDPSLTPLLEGMEDTPCGAGALAAASMQGAFSVAALDALSGGGGSGASRGGSVGGAAALQLPPAEELAAALVAASSPPMEAAASPEVSAASDHRSGHRIVGKSEERDHVAEGGSWAGDDAAEEVTVMEGVPRGAVSSRSSPPLPSFLSPQQSPVPSPPSQRPRSAAAPPTDSQIHSHSQSGKQAAASPFGAAAAAAAADHDGSPTPGTNGAVTTFAAAAASPQRTTTCASASATAAAAAAAHAAPRLDRASSTARVLFQGRPHPSLQHANSITAPLTRTGSGAGFGAALARVGSGGLGLARAGSISAKKSSPNRVCCNALLASYARAAPAQWKRALALLEGMWACGGELTPDIVRCVPGGRVGCYVGFCVDRGADRGFITCPPQPKLKQPASQTPLGVWGGGAHTLANTSPPASPPLAHTLQPSTLIVVTLIPHTRTN